MKEKETHPNIDLDNPPQYILVGNVTETQVLSVLNRLDHQHIH